MFRAQRVCSLKEQCIHVIYLTWKMAKHILSFALYVTFKSGCRAGINQILWGRHSRRHVSSNIYHLNNQDKCESSSINGYMHDLSSIMTDLYAYQSFMTKYGRQIMPYTSWERLLCEQFTRWGDSFENGWYYFSKTESYLNNMIQRCLFILGCDITQYRM